MKRQVDEMIGRWMTGRLNEIDEMTDKSYNR
jgi:hypothetical protein